MQSLWIRVDANIGARDVTWRAAEYLGVSRVTAVGHLVMFWGQVADDASGGDVSDKSDAQLEAWACWDGEPGRFAAFVREHCVSDGRIKHWDAMQGALEERRRRDRERQQRHRASRGVSRDSDVTSQDTVRNSTVQEQKRKTSRAAREADQRPETRTTTTGALSWLAPLEPLWEAKFGAGSFPWGKAGKLLKPLRERPPDELAARFGRWLAESDPKFISLQRFRETYEAWAPVPLIAGPEWVDGWMSPELERLTRPAS